MAVFALTVAVVAVDVVDVVVAVAIVGAVVDGAHAGGFIAISSVDRSVYPPPGLRNAAFLLQHCRRDICNCWC